MKSSQPLASDLEPLARLFAPFRDEPLWIMRVKT